MIRCQLLIANLQSMVYFFLEAQCDDHPDKFSQQQINKSNLLFTSAWQCVRVLSDTRRGCHGDVGKINLPLWEGVKVLTILMRYQGAQYA